MPRRVVDLSETKCPPNHHWVNAHYQGSKWIAGKCVADRGFGTTKEPAYKKYEKVRGSREDKEIRPEDCPEGTYFRKAQTRADGTKVRATCVTKKETQTKGRVEPSRGKCPEGYTFVDSYTRKNGTVVRASCREKRTDEAGRTIVRIPATEGEISKYGYSTRLPEAERYEILDKASDDLGTLPVFRHLNVRAIQNKNRSPESSDLMRSDMNYLQLRMRLGDQFGFWVEDEEEDLIESLETMVPALGIRKTEELIDRLANYYPDSDISDLMGKMKEEARFIAENP